MMVKVAIAMEVIVGGGCFYRGEQRRELESSRLADQVILLWQIGQRHSKKLSSTLFKLLHQKMGNQVIYPQTHQIHCASSFGSVHDLPCFKTKTQFFYSVRIYLEAFLAKNVVIYDKENYGLGCVYLHREFLMPLLLYNIKQFS